MFRWKSLNSSRYFQIFTKLADMGHNVHVVQPPPLQSTDTGFIESDMRLPGNIFIHDTNINKFFWNFNLPLNKIIKKGFYSLIANRDIKRMVKDLNIDAVILYNLSHYPLSRIRDCIKIYDIGDDLIPMLKRELGVFNNSLAINLAKKLLQNMQRNCDIITAISQVLCENNSPEAYVIPNGVNLEDAVIGSGKEIKSKYGRPIIGFVGSFEYYIDFDIILSTAENLKDFTFLLVGGGREFARVKEKVKKMGLANVYLTGGKTHRELMRYIDAMDICINPFLKSPLSHAASPIKLFEYLSFKKPVISTRLRGVQAIDQGFLYYADDAGEMTMAIKGILANQDEAMVKAEKGFNVVKDKYTWGRIAGQILELVKKIKADE